MSQEITHTEIKTVYEALNFQRKFAPILSQILDYAPVEVSAGVRMCCENCHKKSDQLLAPSEMMVIQTDYNHHLLLAKQHNYGEVEQLKVAAIATFVKSQENLLVSEPTMVADKIQRIIDAKTVRDVGQEINATFKEIKTQHSKSFVANVFNAVKESAISVGFSHISVHKPHLGMIRIVGSNQTGQNIIAEIELDKQVDIHTELIGFTDGSCKTIMQAFDDELTARGITTKHKELNPTFGVPQMQYAQRLAKPQIIKRRFFEDEAATNQAESTERITLTN